MLKNSIYCVVAVSNKLSVISNKKDEGKKTHN